MCERVREGKRERACERERARKSVCVCVEGCTHIASEDVHAGVARV